MKRALVLTDDVTRHPFLRRYREIAKAPKPGLGNSAFFLMSFVSGFIIIFGMIA